MKRSTAGVRSLLILACVIALGSTWGLVHAETADASLVQVLAGFDRAQASLRTLSADFRETTQTALLKKPLVAEGRFFMTKPDSVRWEYSRPEEMRFVIAADAYTGYFPAQKRAEKRDIHRWREQLFRFLGVGQASTELAEFYDISLGAPADEMPGSFLLQLDPKKKRVRKRLDQVRLWIDRDTFLPLRIQYAGKNGTTRSIAFEHMRVNPELAASLYVVEIPPGVKVTEGFSAVSGFGASAQN